MANKAKWAVSKGDFDVPAAAARNAIFMVPLSECIMHVEENWIIYAKHTDDSIDIVYWESAEWIFKGSRTTTLLHYIN